MTGEPPPIKQLILIYSGDTLSALQPINNNDEGRTVLKLGGLCALSGAILDYEQSITSMVRQRAMDSGEDASGIRTDFERGLLGTHPFMLLDYGGWERDGDRFGTPYVSLQLRMYHDLSYSAVGVKLMQRLSPEYWKEYSALEAPACLISSGGPVSDSALPVQRVVTRMVHGELWGVASVPLPPASGPESTPLMLGYINAAAAALQAEAVQHSILLCSGGELSLYEQLQTDTRFDVVIGVADSTQAVAQGYGKLPEQGPLLLPALNWGGQEFAACHIIYPAGGGPATDYNFTRHVVQDDLQSPYPYRKQAAAAIKEHKAQTTAARSGNASS